MSYRSQCPDCKTIVQVLDDKGRVKNVPSIVTLPSVPQVRCFGCQKKNGTEETTQHNRRTRDSQVSGQSVRSQKSGDHGLRNRNLPRRDNGDLRVVSHKGDSNRSNEVPDGDQVRPARQSNGRRRSSNRNKSVRVQNARKRTAPLSRPVDQNTSQGIIKSNKRSNPVSELKTFKERVAIIMRDHEAARNNDGTLMAYYIDTYHPDLVHRAEKLGKVIPLSNMKYLPPFESIRRVRAIIQNVDGKYLPTDEKVIKARRLKEKNMTECEVREANNTPV